MSVQILPLSLIFLVHNEWPDIAPLGKISLVQVESPDSSSELVEFPWFTSEEMKLLHDEFLQPTNVHSPP